MNSVIEVKESDLPLHCPLSQAALDHPRVYLQLNAAGEARCPYCGMLYRLAAGQALPNH